MLARYRQNEVHLRASWIFTRADVIANLAVILAALLVKVTQSRMPDIVIGLALCALLEVASAIAGTDDRHGPLSRFAAFCEIRAKAESVTWDRSERNLRTGSSDYQNLNPTSRPAIRGVPSITESTPRTAPRPVPPTSYCLFSIFLT
jgi:hypothetical protein